jgi:Recombination endonuclease VII
VEVRVCRICGVEKDLLKDFSRHAKSKGGFETRCKPCIALYVKCWTYNVTLEWIENKLSELEGKCEICRKPFKDDKFEIDHIDGGKARSLLCRSCNLLLGYAEERTEILEAAIQYLNKHGTWMDEDWP